MRAGIAVRCGSHDMAASSDNSADLANLVAKKHLLLQM